MLISRPLCLLLIVASIASLGLTLLAGCDATGYASKTTPTVDDNEKASPTPTPRFAFSADDPPALPTAEDIASKAEKLPDPPKLMPTHQHKPLLPDGSLLLEVKPIPDQPGKTQSVRVLLKAEVCLTKGFLEVFLCKKGTKEHEAIVRTSVDAKLIHGALLALGAKPGQPVQFINPKTEEAEYKPASGDGIKVSVVYRNQGQVHTRLAQEWIRDQKSGKAMTHRWVFAGSRLITNPDRPEDPPYYTANNGEIISVSNFIDSMLELPVSIGTENHNLNFEVFSERVPSLLSKVWIILEKEPR